MYDKLFVRQTTFIYLGYLEVMHLLLIHNLSFDGVKLTRKNLDRNIQIVQIVFKRDFADNPPRQTSPLVLEAQKRHGLPRTRKGLQSQTKYYSDLVVKCLTFL